MNPLAVRPFQETLHAGMCGPAALKMVLAYWGTEREEQELAILCKTDRSEGTLDTDIVTAAENLGYEAQIIRNSSLDELQQWMNRGVPPIVQWFTNGRPEAALSETADGHYSVVVALDGDSISLQDPEIGNMRTLPRSAFLKVWFDFNGSQITSWDQLLLRTFIVVYPRGK